MAVELPRRKFTAEDLAKMDQAGLFDEDHRIELVDGDVVRMSPPGVDDTRCVNRLTMRFARAGLQEVWIVDIPHEVDELLG